MEDISLLTKHRKADVIQSVMEGCGFSLRTIDSFDTDQLGTFTGEQARLQNQLDTALHKAQLGAQLGNTRYGLGSEGSFGPDPFIGMTPWNAEVLAWWDSFEQHAVYAIMQGPETNYHQKYVRSMDEVTELMSKYKFPDHGLIVGKPGDRYFNKEIDSEESMLTILPPLLRQSPVWIETDMRAHRNPTRMSMIERCAKRLAENLRLLCPSCTSRGFVGSAQIPGAICESCGTATRVARAELFSCTACGFTEEKNLAVLAPASKCDCCNP